MNLNIALEEILRFDDDKIVKRLILVGDKYAKTASLLRSYFIIKKEDFIRRKPGFFTD